MAKKDLYNEAQESLIASLLFDGEKVGRVLELVSFEDFSEPSLSLIMKALTEVARRSETVSVVSVARELDAMGELEATGGAPNLYRLRTIGEEALMAAQPDIYASILKESSAKHKIKQLLTDSESSFTDDSGTLAREGVAVLQNSLSQEVLRLADDATLTDISSHIDNYFELIEEREEISKNNEEKAEGLQGIPSMLPSLNKYTSGFMPQQLITVGAKTGVGKSVFAIMTAVAAARAGKSVMFFSLEMSRDEIIDRIVANMSSVSLTKLKQGRVSDEDREKVVRAVEELKNSNIVIDTDAKSSIDSIRSKALRQSQTEEGLDMIIVDYLQLITSSSRFNNRQEIVADLSRNMKLMAKSMNVPIMILSQLNRGKQDEEDKTPTLDNIRESGAIAQDSDIVLLLHRDANIDNTTPHTLVILEKNRNGESHKTIRCQSILECSMFREIVREKDISNTMTEEELEELATSEEYDLSEFGDFDDDISIEGL